MMTRALFLLFLVLMAGQANAQKAPALEELLSKMGESLSVSSYRASYVLFDNGKIRTFRVWHSVSPQGIIFERLESLSGAPHLVLRRADGIYFLDGERAIRLNDERIKPLLRWQRVVTQLAENRKNYQIGYIGMTRLAGRNAHHVVFVPHKRDRAGMHLWLDEETGLPLGAAKFLPSGQMVQQWLSVEFQLQKDMNPELFALPPSNALTDDAQGGHIDVNAPWRITWQPDGFVLVKNRRLGPMPAPIWHWLYTDGLNAYSVFIDEAPQSKKMVLGQAFDSEHLIFEKTTQKYRLTIIGAVPKVVAEKIANSVIKETTPQP